MGGPATTREPELAPGPAAPPRPFSSVTLVALIALLTTQSLRVLFPLAYNLGERTSFISAGMVALALSLTPFLAPLLIRPLGLRRALVVTVAGLAAARLLIQVVHPVPLWLASAAVVLGLLALTTVLVSIRGGRTRAAGIVLGFAVDTAIRGAYWTWDYAWQDGAIPVLLTVAAGGAAIFLALRLLAGESPPGGRVLGLVALGPFLFLQLLFLQSPAFVASAGRFSLPAASAFVLAGDALALVLLSWPREQTTARRLAVGIGVLVVGVALSTADGPRVAVDITAGVPLSSAMLAWSLDVPPGGRQIAWRESAILGLASFAFVLFTLLYYLHYDSPLPFPNTILPIVAAVILVALGIPKAAGADATSARWAFVPLALLVLPASTIHWGSDPAPAVAAGSSFRLLDYNIHSGVSPTGQLNPEAIARVIEAEQPDVVVLNEVNRGWAIAGGIDLAEWLSQRLDLEYVYSPAADGQFGNAVMSRFPITRVMRVTLPKAGGPMLRNATLATLDLGNGRVADVIAVHLDHRDEGRETRLTQIGVLLDFWNQRPVTVIAGDMNARPESDEIAALLGAGLVSAQDEAGDPSLETYPSLDPDRRIDYVFGSNDITFSDFRIPRTTASDHLPLSVTVAAGT